MKSKNAQKHQIKAIIFDCVGPLLIKNQKNTLTPITKEINNRCGKATDEVKFWSEMKNIYKIDGKELSLIKDQIVNYYVRNKEMFVFHKQIAKKYKTGIINNGIKSIFHKWILKFGFKKDFDVLFNSTELGIKKPDPRTYKLMAKKLKVLPAQCVFIDDNIINTIGAEKVGMVGIVYKPGFHNEFIKQISKVLN